MSTFLTMNGANALLGWALNTAGVWVGLGSGTSSGVSTGGVFPELSGVGYSRQFPTNWTVTSGVGYPTSGVTFGPSASGWTAFSIGLFTAQTSGSLWWAGDLLASAAVGVGNFASFTSGAFAVGFLASGFATESESAIMLGNVLILGNLTVDGNITQN